METDQLTTDRPRPHVSDPPAPSRRLVAAATAWSAVAVALGLWWLLDPAAYPLGPRLSEDPSGLVQLVPRAVVATTLLVLGVAGAPLATGLGRVTGDRRGRRALLAAGAGYAVVLVVLVPDVQVLAVLGYLVALSAPLVVVALLTAGARRHPRNLIPLAVIGAAVLVGVLTGHIGAPTLELLGEIRDGFGRVGLRPVVLAVLVGGGALFGLLTLSAAGRREACSPERAARLDRWGRVATYVAAASPVPYAAVRMTWLTPWPQGAPGGAEAIDPGIRVFGLLLGLAAVGGAILTLGLVRPWGEVFPSWLPRLRGRPVPVTAAVLPATVVCLALLASSVSLVMLAVAADAGWLVAAIPAPVWGPALGLATYAYYRRRTAGRTAAG